MVAVAGRRPDQPVVAIESAGVEVLIPMMDRLSWISKCWTGKSQCCSLRLFRRRLHPRLSASLQLLGAEMVIRDHDERRPYISNCINGTRSRTGQGTKSGIDIKKGKKSAVSGVNCLTCPCKGVPICGLGPGLGKDRS